MVTCVTVGVLLVNKHCDVCRDFMALVDGKNADCCDFMFLSSYTVAALAMTLC